MADLAFLKEPGIALGKQTVFVATALGNGPGRRIAYAWRRRDVADDWHSDILCDSGSFPPAGPPYHTLLDLSVAHDANRSVEDQFEEYLIFVLASAPGLRAPLVARMHLDLVSESASVTWVEAAVPAQPPPTIIFDKTFMVAGSRGEFYTVWWRDPIGDGVYQYARTGNGGLNASDWQGGNITLDGNSVTGKFAIQPTVYGASRIYLAHHTGTLDTAGGDFAIAFLAGRDGAPGPVNFWRLKDDQGEDLRIPYQYNANPEWGEAVPGDFGFSGKFTAQVAIDPTDFDRFYVVYQDTECPANQGPPHNMSIWIQRIEYEDEVWTMEGPYLVSQEAVVGLSCSEPHYDQILPAVVVDTQQRIHIVYYDDGAFAQDDVSVDPSKWNLVNARSCDFGETWEHQTFGSLTPGAPQPPFLDFALGYDTPREYIAIAFREESDGSVTIAAAAPGTHAGTAPCAANVIYTIISQQ